MPLHGKANLTSVPALEPAGMRPFICHVLPGSINTARLFALRRLGGGRLKIVTAALNRRTVQTASFAFSLMLAGGPNFRGPLPQWETLNFKIRISVD